MGNRTKIFAVFAGLAVLVACSSLRSRIPQLENPLAKGPLAKILVFVGNVPLGETGPTPDGSNMNIGGRIFLTAQGRDMNNKPLAIVPKWSSVKPEVLEIAPSVGDAVQVKALREGTGGIVVEAEGVRRVIEYIFVK